MLFSPSALLIIEALMHDQAIFPAARGDLGEFDASGGFIGRVELPL